MRGQGGFPHRLAAGLHHECIVVRDLRTAPRAGLGELRRRLDGIERSQRIGTGSESVGVVKRGPHQVREHGAFAGRGAFAGLGDAAIEI